MKLIKPFPFLGILSICLTWYGCKDNSITPGGTNLNDVTAQDFSHKMDEYPQNDDVIGTVSASANQGDLIFSLLEQNPSGALDINVVTGVLTVADQSKFIYDNNKTITAQYIASNVSGADTASIVIQLNKVPVQSRLDNGETPFEIYTSNPDLHFVLFGKKYKGGYIYSFNPNKGNGRVFSDKIGEYPWGCKGKEIDTGQWSNLSKLNTEKILAGCSESNIAAKACDDYSVDGNSDWHLPSGDDLPLAYFQLHSDNPPTIDPVWSSSQSDANSAQATVFKYGHDTTISKDQVLTVYAVHSFDE